MLPTWRDATGYDHMVSIVSVVSMLMWVEEGCLNPKAEDMDSICLLQQGTTRWCKVHIEPSGKP